MTEAIVKTKKLSFSFRENVRTLDHVEMLVPKGSIYGFLGPNGAGKTTTLRLVLGLLRLQEGSIEIFGRDFKTHRLQILRRLGSMIEDPSLYGHLTAPENLTVYRDIYNVGKDRINEVLEIVGLENTGRKKARQFSLGMKQRLSIALALLPDPELLILDEPTNGLDPNGIVEIRELLKKLNRESGKTILVSSHLLAEVERMATHVGIIHKGKMLFQGELSELQQMKMKQSGLVIETSDNVKASSVLSSKKIQFSGEKIIVPYENKEQSAEINRILIDNGLKVYSLHPRHSDLEELFMEITSNGI